jgi:DNA repair photolyase
MEGARRLREAGLRVVITVSPLLPIDEPEEFFRRLRDVADGVVIDHFIDGDGSMNGSRTLRTALPGAMAAVSAESVMLEYRERIVEIARRYFPGNVGVNIDGFAGRFS